MDAERFDAVARALGAMSSRRRLNRALGGVATGGSLAALSVEQASAKKKKKKKKKQDDRPCPKGCPGELCCNGACVSVLTDSNNCGACGNMCANTQFCSTGVCTPCDVPKAVCRVAGIDICVDVKTDRDNCGSCGAGCARDFRNPARDLVCQNGTCVCTGLMCANGRCCPAGYTVCVNGGDGCCPTDYHPCGNGECCPIGYTCGGSCGQGCCRA